MKCQDPIDGSGDVIIDLPPDVLVQRALICPPVPFRAFSEGRCNRDTFNGSLGNDAESMRRRQKKKGK